jgi:recombination protein RecT
MDVETIEQIKSAGKNNDDIWGKWWGEMARKAVLRRLSKRIPIPDSVRDVVEARDLDIDLDNPVPTENQARPKLIEQIPAQTLRSVIPEEKEAVPAQAASTGEVLAQASSEDSDVL